MLESVDINCDVGEVSCEHDFALLPLLSSCNVSCGVHAGNPALIASTVREALRLGVAIGAHPSYPDPKNFGRQNVDLPLPELAEHLRYQICAVRGMVISFGGQLRHVKPHGALYHRVSKNPDVANLVIEVIQEIDSNLILYGQADSMLAEICSSKQMRFVHEVFGDRRYEDQTSLRSRNYEDAVIDNTKDFQQQLNGLLESSVVDMHGQAHTLTVQTICLHSDTARAVDFARLTHSYLKENHVRMAAP